MDEGEDDKNKRQEDVSGETTGEGNEVPDSPRQWLDMSYSESPLFDMLSHIASATMTAKLERLDVESISSTSSSLSSSSSSSVTETSANGSSKDDCVIWVEPLGSCRIYEHILPDEGCKRLAAKPSNLRCRGPGGGTRPALRHHSATSRCVHRKPTTFLGGTGDSGEDGKDVDKTNAKESTFSMSHDHNGCVTGETREERNQAKSTVFKHTQNDNAQCGLPTDHWKPLPKSDECLEFTTGINNNHPGKGDDGQNSDIGDLSFSSRLKHNEEDILPDGDGDTRIGAKDTENDARPNSGQTQTLETHGLPPPLLVKPVALPSIVRHQPPKAEDEKNGDPLKEMKQVQTIPECHQVTHCAGSISTPIDTRAYYPFEHGTFRAWTPDSVSSQSGSLDASSKTAWSAHVTREHRFSCGHLNRSRMDSFLQNGSQSCQNRTSQTTRLSDIPIEALPKPSETRLQCLQVEGSECDRPHEALNRSQSNAKVSPGVPFRYAKYTETFPSKRNNKKHIVTLTEIQQALDIALFNLSKLDSPDVSCARTDGALNTFTESSNESQGESVKEDNSHISFATQTFSVQEESTTTSEKTGPIAEHVVSDFCLDNDSIQFAPEADKLQDPSKGIVISHDGGPESVSNKKTDRMNKGIYEKHDCGENHGSNAKASEQKDKPHAKNDSVGAEEKVDIHNVESENLFAPTSPVEETHLHRKTLKSSENKCEKAEPACDSDIWPNTKTIHVKEDSSDTEQYSKSLTDDTFATGSPTVQDGEYSHEASSPIQENNFSIAAISTDISLRSPEVFAPSMKTEKGEGDGKPTSVMDMPPAGVELRRNANRSFEKLDLDTYSNNNGGLTCRSIEAEDQRAGMSKSANERRSRRNNDTNSSRELFHVKGKSMSDTRVGVAQCPSSSNRQTRSSDTLLVRSSTPGNHFYISGRSGETVLGRLNFEHSTHRNSKTPNRTHSVDTYAGGERMDYYSNPTADLEDHFPLNERSRDHSNPNKSRRSMKERFSSLFSTCWKQK